MSKTVKPVPEGYHTVTPYLVVRGAAKAIEFYKQAFGAEETVRMPGPDGTVMHAELRIGDSVVMLGDEAPGTGSRSPQTLGGTTGGLMLYVPDVDALCARALKAGATLAEPLKNVFWGDRYGKVTDPFGHTWSIATHVEDVSPEEMEERMRKEMPQAASA
ncbi:MAG: VOC family protein [Myxococcaceae bacterium]|nr:VOC family protein [Myxococcaceae bacterium]MCI0669572.1 VOC family protein [Myxococcaceae bacterium]